MGLLTKPQLTSALLSLSQMPAGWSTDSTSTSTSSGDKTFCDYRQPHKAQVQVFRTFQKGGGLTATVASVGLRQYASASDAAESLATAPSVAGQERPYAPQRRLIAPTETARLVAG